MDEQDYSQADRDPITAEEERYMRRVIRWLLPGNSARRAVEEILSTGDTRVPSQVLCGQVGERHGARERLASVWCLGRMKLSEEERAYAGYTLCWNAMEHRSYRPWACIGSVVPCVAPISWIFLLYSILKDRSARSIRAMSTTALGRLGYVPALPLLVKGLAAKRELRRAAEFAVPATLRFVRKEDYGRLPPDVVPAICGLLSGHSGNIQLLALEALERAGDGRAVESVLRLANQRRSDEKRDAAARALEVLEERRRRETEPHRLLRAVDSPTSPQTVLLRPASSSGDANPELLLRASTGEEEAE